MDIPCVWRCEICKHVDLEVKFRTPDGHFCPKCKDEDVFPMRRFRCKSCGQEGSQHDFFREDTIMDEDPLKNGEIPVCPNDDCPSRADEDWKDPNPTEVTEIPVPGFTAA